MARRIESSKTSSGAPGSRRRLGAERSVAALVHGPGTADVPGRGPRFADLRQEEPRDRGRPRVVGNEGGRQAQAADLGQPVAQLNCGEGVQPVTYGTACGSVRDHWRPPSRHDVDFYTWREPRACPNT